MKRIWKKEIKIGECILDFIKDENDKKKAKENFDRVLNGEKFTLREEYGEIPNRTMWEDRYSPIIEDDKVVGIAVFVIDITEIFNSQKVIKELNLFKKLVDLSGVGITISDPKKEDNPLVFVNSSFVKLTKYKKDEVIGKNARFLQGSDRTQNVIRKLKEAIDNKNSLSVEIKNYKKMESFFIIF